MLFNKPHCLGEWMGRWLFEAGEDFKDFEANINNKRKLLLNHDSIHVEKNEETEPLQME